MTSSPRHRWAMALACAFLLTLAFLKLARPSLRSGSSLMSLCSDPWAETNALMGLAAAAAGIGLFFSSQRRRAACLGLLTMTIAAGSSVWAGITKTSLTGCGCLGSLDAPWWTHFLVAAVVSVACARAIPAVNATASAPVPAAGSRRRTTAAPRRD